MPLRPTAPVGTSEYYAQERAYFVAEAREHDASVRRMWDRLATPPSQHGMEITLPAWVMTACGACCQCCPDFCSTTNTPKTIYAISTVFYLGFLSAGIALTMGAAGDELRGAGVAFQAIPAIGPGVWYLIEKVSDSVVPAQRRKEGIVMMILLSILNVSLISTSIAIFATEPNQTGIGVALLLVASVFFYGLYSMYKFLPPKEEAAPAPAPSARAPGYGAV
jgi:hypothetical protein